MKAKSKDLETLLHYLARMQRYKLFIELCKDKDDLKGYKLMYKEDEKNYLHLHNKIFGKS